MSMKGSGTRLPMRGKDENKRSQSNKSTRNRSNNTRHSNTSTPNSSTSSSKSTAKKKLLSVDTKTIPVSASPSKTSQRRQQQQRVKTNTTASSPINFSGGPNSPTRTKEQLEILLNEREETRSEIENLYNEIEILKEKVLRSEHERDNVQSKLHRSEKEILRLKSSHTDITADMKLKIKKLTRRVKLVNTIENALLELYFEIRDRSMDDFDQNGTHTNHTIRSLDIEKEKRKLLNECNNDILVVLDHLRANIRIQFAFKEDYERELKGSLDRKQNAHVNEVNRMNGMQQALNLKVQKAEQGRKDAIERMEKAESSKKIVMDEAKHMVEIANRKIEDLKERIVEGDLMMKEHELKLKEAFDRVHQAEKSEMQIAQLQEKLHTQQLHAERQLLRSDTLHQTEVKRLNHQLLQANSIKARNDKLESECKHLKRELASYKQNLKLAKYTTAEAKSEYSEQQMFKAQKELAKFKEKFIAASRVAEQRANTIASMKGKYNEMFERKKKYLNKKAITQSVSSNRIKEIADQNPSYAAYYKKKLLASEQRVKELTKMLKSFMMSEHKKKTALTSTRLAAQRYQVELDTVKNQLLQSEKTRNDVEQKILDMELQRRRRRRRPQSAGVTRGNRSSKIDPIINRLKDTSSLLSASSSVVSNNNNADAFLNELKEELKEEQNMMMKNGNAQSMPIISTTSVISETSQYDLPISFQSSKKK